MKKDTKTYLFLGIIVIIIIIAIYLSRSTNPAPEEDLAKCIASNSELYVQLGCSACKIQEDIFGESFIYLNVVDCAKTPEICIEKQISKTPTWIIRDKKYEGLKSLELLKEETGC